MFWFCCGVGYSGSLVVVVVVGVVGFVGVYFCVGFLVVIGIFMVVVVMVGLGSMVVMVGEGLWQCGSGGCGITVFCGCCYHR